jgi:4-diphosphocytidyl-2-C-methyl-D-erythritol kinase
LYDDVEASVGSGVQVTVEGVKGLDVSDVPVDDNNLAARAVRMLAERTRIRPNAHLHIRKRIPVAGGMAGGSADAAAALRLAAEASGLGDRRTLEDVAARLGSDVASQVRGGLVLATGPGSRLRPLNVTLAYSVVVVPIDEQLSAADVYAEADRLGLTRESLDLARALTRTQAALSSETILERLHNDLQDAARSLCPAIDGALEAVLAAGADYSLVSGSGPTVLGIFVGAGHRERGRRVCESLAGEGWTPEPLLTRPSGPAAPVERI